jgi:16S rRNA A1518/A1519 N6-dimethyltransferase RsmA/KsgA/DIM1 with predicted DNA glycosylase/AP lyase activity
MERGDTSENKRQKHRGKFTEGLLDNEPILKALNIKAGQTILDAGCGNGYMSKVFSNEVTRSGKVYALDPDKYFIKVLKNETQGTNIETIEGDITRTTQLNESSVDGDTRFFKKANERLFEGGETPSQTRCIISNC